MEGLGASDRMGRPASLLQFEDPSDRCLELLDKLWVHEFVLIGYVEDMDGLAFERCRVFRHEARLVPLFHGEDDLRPAKIGLRHMVLGGLTRASRSYRQTRMRAPDAFRSRAAPLIATADEQDMYSL